MALVQEIAQKLNFDYWLGKFSGLEVVSVFTSTGDRDRLLYQTEIPAAGAEALRLLARQDSVNEYTIYLTLYGLLLKRFFNQTDVLVGSPAFEVISEDDVNGVSFFHIPLPEETILKDNIRTVKEEVLTTLKYKGVRLQDLGVLLAGKGLSDRPLAQFGLYHDAVHNSIDALDAMPFILSVSSNKDKSVTLEIRANIHEKFKNVVGEFAESFKLALEGLKESMDLPWRDVGIVSSAARSMLISRTNPFSAQDDLRTIVQIFEEQVALTPDNPAVVYQDTVYTYRELNERCNRFARYLRDSCNVGSDTLVGCLLDRSESMIISILAILKAGGAYVPLDPQYPQERIGFILKDSAISVLITQSDYLGVLPDYTGRVFAIDVQLEGLVLDAHNLKGVNSRDDLAYVIYTSGSTGEPKGVMIEHRGVVNLVSGLHEAVYKNLAAPLRIGLISSFVFDASVKQIFYALLRGHCLCILPDADKKSGDRILEYFSQKNIDVSDGTPSLLNVVLNASPELIQACEVGCFVIGGEALTPSVLQKFNQIFGLHRAAVVNVYGPTECCVDATSVRINHTNWNPHDIVSIGAPLLNKRIYVLDKNLNLLPDGAIGEICIGGEGVSRGYINRDALTMDRFVVDPFSAGPGMKVYRSGDLGRWLSDGSLQFVGRADGQVKVRGYRIELEEIERSVLKIAGIQEAIASVISEGDSKIIVVYYVSSEKFKQKELRALLQRRLPDFMLPNYFVFVDRIPLTINGKVNRAALPDPRAMDNDGEDFAEPVTEMEKRLASVWEKVLGKKAVGVRDDFFSLGGDSIQAIQVASRMHEMHFKLEVKDIFQYLTIKSIAPHVTPLGRVPDQSVVVGEFPLTPIQRRFFNHARVPSHANMSIMLHFKRGIDDAVVRAIFNKIVEHHDVLRTTFVVDDDSIIANNHSLDYSFDFFSFDLVKNPDIRIEDQANELQASLDLQKGPLVKVALFHGIDGDRLLVVIHHLLVDGVSWRILLEDIETLYQKHMQKRKLTLPLKTDSFKVWSEKLTQYANTDAALVEKQIWRNILSSAPSMLPRDFTGNGDRISDAVFTSFAIDEAKTQSLLANAGNVFNTSVNELLLAGLSLALQKIFLMDRILIALEGHGRESIMPDVDISRTVGWFTSEFPVLIPVNVENGLSRHIKIVKESLRQIPNKGVGYGILKHLTIEPNGSDVDFSTQPEIRFNYLGQFDSDVRNLSFDIASDFKGRQYADSENRKYALEVSGSVMEGQLHLFIEYNKTHFEEATIQKLSSAFSACILEVLNHCVGQSGRELTPSDLTYKRLSMLQLEELERRFDSNISDIYPLSSLQEAILFQNLLDEQNAAYFYQTVFTYHGLLAESLVRESLTELFKRHDILRTSFLYNDVERPLQIVLRQRSVDFYFEDIADIADKDTYLQRFLKADADRKFDLANDVLIRLSIFRIGQSMYQMVLSRHHILLDAWSSRLLLREYFEIYESLRDGKELNHASETPFKMFIQWLESRRKEADTKYWRQYLDGYDIPVRLPRNGIMHDSGKYSYKIRRFFASQALTREFRDVCDRSHVTLNTAIQVLWGIVLMKNAGCSDVVFGSVVSGRQADVKDIENIIGLFINTVPVRIQSDLTDTLAAALREAQERSVENNDYQHFPLVEICALTPLKANLFDHIVIFENVPSQDGSRTQEREEPADNGQDETIGYTSYDLKLIVVPGATLKFTIGYNESVYSADFIEYLEKTISQLIHTLVVSQEVLVSDVLESIDRFSIASPVSGRATVPVPDAYEVLDARWVDASIGEIFEYQVSRNGDKRALRSLDKEMSYRELNGHANVVCDAVVKCIGGNAGKNVVLLLTEAFEMVPALLGVLKSGNVYVPLDTEYPLARLEYIVQDVGAELLITSHEFMHLAAGLQEKLGKTLPVITVSDLDASGFNNENPSIKTSPDSIAYILYTSGSTGQPKGVVQTHQYVTHLTFSFVNSLKLSHTDNITLFPSFNFSASIMDIFGALLSGASIAQWSFNKNGFTGLTSWINQLGITVFHSVPSLFRHFMKSLDPDERFDKIRMIYLAGEPTTKADFDLYKIHFSAACVFANGLGCTEFNICRQMFLDKATTLHTSLVPVGYQATGAEILIVGDDGEALERAGVGEIVVKSNYLAQGYWNQAEVTAEKFKQTSSGERLYFTGDIGQRYDDGCLVHLGRKDFQVKIRGQRVEPVEIELALERFHGVREAVVIGVTDLSGEIKLVGYVVAADTSITAVWLRKALRDSLPIYMIPETFVFIPSIPKTPSGKVDRKTLMDMTLPEEVNESTIDSELSDIEGQLIAIWEEVLNRTNIRVHDNFFDLGGHSIKLILVKSKVERVFNVQMNLKTFFINTSVKELAIEVEALVWVQNPTLGDELEGSASVIVI